MIDPETSVIGARVRARQYSGRSPSRCEWGRGHAEHCPVPVPDTEFFCQTHEAQIRASDDPYVREAWERFQTELASYHAPPNDPEP